MGEPACLPSFKELAKKIAQGTGELLQDEAEDRFLGRLHDKGNLSATLQRRLSPASPLSRRPSTIFAYCGYHPTRNPVRMACQALIPNRSPWPKSTSFPST